MDNSVYFFGYIHIVAFIRLLTTYKPYRKKLIHATAGGLS